MNLDLLTGFTAGVTASGIAVGLTAWATARRLLRRAETSACTDALTGLLNRKGWEKAAASCANKTGGPQDLYVVLADCNGLKAINDTYGHETGDAIIADAAQRLRQGLGDDAVIARLGGDEFAALAPGLRLEADMAGFFATAPAGTGPVGPTVDSHLAVGVAALDGDLATAIRRADAAMYRNKRSGGIWCWYDPRLDDDTTHHPAQRPAVRTRDLDTTPATEANTGTGAAVGVA
ncbi:hypothetical protein GCM10027447_01940 [Glycomyces halotolerans]